MTDADAAASVGVVVVAAGSGTRLGAGVPKAFVAVGGATLLQHALQAALAVGCAAVVVVVPPERVQQAQAVADALDPGPEAQLRVVAGGAERSDSVRAGLAALPDGCELVLVHDAARCLTPPAVYERVVAALQAGAVAAVPGLAVVDTIKQVDGTGRVVATPPRSSLRSVQTPQGFRASVLRQAHESGLLATDDAALVEALGIPVLVVQGDARARKVTTPDDLGWAEATLAAQD